MQPNEVNPTQRNPSWVNKFRIAFRGLRHGIQSQSSFAVHIFVAVLVLVAASIFRCDPYEWALLLMCIGSVMTTELVNTAIETLFRGLPVEARDQVYLCLDIAAGAVLVASMTAVVIGCVIFIPKVL